MFKITMKIIFYLKINIFYFFISKILLKKKIISKTIRDTRPPQSLFSLKKAQYPIHQIHSHAS